MKHIKVSLYVREHGTRRYNKVPDRNRPNYPPTTTYVLRYGSTWETLTVDTLSDATAKRIERELELLRGWRPTAKPKPEAATKVKMLDEAIDAYLEETALQRCSDPASLRCSRELTAVSNGCSATPVLVFVMSENVSVRNGHLPRIGTTDARSPLYEHRLRVAPHVPG